jgi:O-antigen ligase
MNRSPSSDRRGAAVRLWHGTTEAVVLLLVCLSPWAFGAVHPLFEALVYAGLAVALLLWATAILAGWQLRWQNCPVALCIAALFLYGAAQLIDWPEPWLTQLSPGSAWWSAQLLPERLEVSAGGETLATPVAATLTLYPAATRLALLRLLAVLLLFLVVRNTFASERSLRRLSLAVVANGLALTLFALAQHYSTPGNVVYWRFPIDGIAFGPFIQRNHFAFYTNLCLLLGLGLLAQRRHGRVHEWPLMDLLARPAVGGTAVVLAFLTAGVLVSQSRGGFVALLAGAGFTLSLGWRGSGKTLWAVVAAAVIVLLTVWLLFWLGLSRVPNLLAALWEGEPGSDPRLLVWSRALEVVWQFPVWGAGYGTFETVLPLGLEPGDSPRHALTQAHNDYLEAWLEGGVVRLAVSLLAIFWVYRLGLRARRKHRGHRTAALVLGALAAFTTAVVHSFFDFGLHLPAIAALTAVIAAHLAALGAPHEPVRLRGLVPPLAAIVLTALALVLAAEGYHYAQAERYRLAAEQLAAAQGSAADRARQVEYAAAAVAYLPDDATLHAGLADAHLLALADALRRQPPEDRGALEERHVGPALAHAVRARDLCPLQARAQALLAGFGKRLRQADPSVRYLERAALLRPADATILYVLGLERLRLGEVGPAANSWEKSLRCSTEFRDEVVQRCADRADATTLLGQIFADRPEALAEAGFKLFRAEEEAPELRACAEAALAALNRRAGMREAKDYYTKAKVYRALDRSAEALMAFRDALALQPSETAWRLEYARLLFEQGLLVQARREAEAVLVRDRDYPGAAQLWRAILTEIPKREK